MAPVIVRRVVLPAPVAVSVRRSCARLAADQADGHREYAEGDEQPGSGGVVAQLGQRLVCGSGLDGEAGAGGEVAGVVDWAVVSVAGVWISHAAGSCAKPRTCMAWTVMSVVGSEE